MRGSYTQVSRDRMFPRLRVYPISYLISCYVTRHFRARSTSTKMNNDEGAYLPVVQFQKGRYPRSQLIEIYLIRVEQI